MSLFVNVSDDYPEPTIEDYRRDNEVLRETVKRMSLGIEILEERIKMKCAEIGRLHAKLKQARSA